MVARMASGTRVAGCVVNVNWNADNRKWNVNAWKLDDDNWNAGNRVFSRNSRYIFETPTLPCGSLRFDTFLPSTKHLAYFKKWFGKGSIFCSGKNLNFPRNAKQELKPV